MGLAIGASLFSFLEIIFFALDLLKAILRSCRTVGRDERRPKRNKGVKIGLKY